MAVALGLLIFFGAAAVSPLDENRWWTLIRFVIVLIVLFALGIAFMSWECPYGWGPG